MILDRNIYIDKDGETHSLLLPLLKSPYGELQVVPLCFGNSTEWEFFNLVKNEGRILCDELTPVTCFSCRRRIFAGVKMNRKGIFIQ